MTFDQYLPISIIDIILYGLLWAVIIAAVVGAVTALVCLAFKTEGAKQAIMWSFVVGAGMGLLGGGIGGGTSVNDDNYNILQTNISKKYNATITNMGEKPSSRGASYSPTDKRTHEVTIVADNKSQLALLAQDEKTNEPTLLDYDTQQPKTDILKK